MRRCAIGDGLNLAFDSSPLPTKNLLAKGFRFFNMHKSSIAASGGVANLSKVSAARLTCFEVILRKLGCFVTAALLSVTVLSWPTVSIAAGTTTTQQGDANLSGDTAVKTGAINEVVFNDTNGPRPFVHSVQITLVKRFDRTTVNVSFMTNGGLGGGIDWNNFPYELTHNGAVVWEAPSIAFEGKCRGDFGHTGSSDAPPEMFDLADGIRIPVFSVNVYPC